MEAEELLDHERELVGGALGDGRDAPVVDELGVVEEPDDGLRVPGVDRQQHGRLLSIKPVTAVTDVQADVEHRHRVRERADRDEVGARLGVRPDGLERDAARHLDRDRTLEQRDRLADLVGRHVVEQDTIGRGVACLGHLVERVALDLDHPARPRRPGPLDRLRDAGRGDVVVLDQHRVAERVAVVEAAAGAHRRPLNRAQAGKRLAGVEDARPCRARPCT